MSARIRRDRRRAGVQVVLGARDESLLRALGRFRLARTDDLIRLFFAGTRRDTAVARLRRLFDGGFLEARYVGVDESNLYALGPKGAAWAEHCGHPHARPPQGPPEHHLGIVGCWSVLATTLASHPGIRLGRFEPDWELRSRLAGQGVPVVPDAAIEIAERSGQAVIRRFALEVDLGSERRGALRHKLSRYDLTPIFQGAPTPSLMVVLQCAGSRRIAAVKSLVAELWPGESIVCTESDWLRHALEARGTTPLTTTSDGKGTNADGTLCDDAEFAPQGEGPSR